MTFKFKRLINLSVLSHHIISYETAEPAQSWNREAKSQDAVSVRWWCPEKTSWKATYVLSWRRKVHSNWEDVTSSGRAFSGIWASNRESTATDGWSLDRWHQKTIGACRTKRPSAGKTAYILARAVLSSPVKILRTTQAVVSHVWNFFTVFLCSTLLPLVANFNLWANMSVEETNCKTWPATERPVWGLMQPIN